MTGLRPVPCASHHIGVAAIDILVVRRSTRHPWRYDPNMAAMLSHAKGIEIKSKSKSAMTRTTQD